jgi:hypothetical protein
MPTTGSDRVGPGSHIGLLRSTPQCQDRIHSWLRAAMTRGDQVATVAVPADLSNGAQPGECSGSDGGIDFGGLVVPVVSSSGV